MNGKRLLASTFVAALGVAGVIGTIAIAADEAPAEAKPAAAAAEGQPEMKLPPGWTEADMQACMAAGTPGEQHQRLAKQAGEWEGTNTMWMAPGADPMKTPSTSTVTAIMDGRYTKVEMKGEMPGMGPYHGHGIYGFDNVSRKFVCTWIDNHSTGIMQGTGDLSEDGKTITWSFTYNCPLNKKPAVIKEVETMTGDDTKTIEMWGTEPKSGEEFQMMKIELTRKSGGDEQAQR